MGEKERAQKGGTLVGRIHGDGGLALPDYDMKRSIYLRNTSQNKFIELLLNTENSSFF